MLILLDSHTRIDVYTVVFHAIGKQIENARQRQTYGYDANNMLKHSKHERQMGIWLVPKTDSVTAPSTNFNINFHMSNDDFFSLFLSLSIHYNELYSQTFSFSKMEFQHLVWISWMWKNYDSLFWNWKNEFHCIKFGFVYSILLF